ncbi:MAG: hypothetical protein ACFFC6_08610 [Promethearchaeota archaeon]
MEIREKGGKTGDKYSISLKDWNLVVSYKSSRQVSGEKLEQKPPPKAESLNKRSINTQAIEIIREEVLHEEEQEGIVQTGLEILVVLIICFLFLFSVLYDLSSILRVISSIDEITLGKLIDAAFSDQIPPSIQYVPKPIRVSLILISLANFWLLFLILFVCVPFTFIRNRQKRFPWLKPNYKRWTSLADLLASSENEFDTFIFIEPDTEVKTLSLKNVKARWPHAVIIPLFIKRPGWGLLLYFFLIFTTIIEICLWLIAFPNTAEAVAGVCRYLVVFVIILAIVEYLWRPIRNGIKLWKVKNDLRSKLDEKIEDLRSDRDNSLRGGSTILSEISIIMDIVEARNSVENISWFAPRTKKLLFSIFSLELIPILLEVILV